MTVPPEGCARASRVTTDRIASSSMNATVVVTGRASSPLAPAPGSARPDAARCRAIAPKAAASTEGAGSAFGPACLTGGRRRASGGT
jgi:hypothetical protein